MKKTFPLEVAGLKAPRVVAAIKHDVRKYVKRERRKTLPEGVDFWDFDCKVGQSADTAETQHVEAVVPAIDAAAAAGWSEVFIEILAKPGHRTKKAAPEGGDAEG